MADFEGLIRQALARQDDKDPAVRERVYRSSRAALARMIASAGTQPEQVIETQKRALENSIARIEAGYGRLTARPQPPGPEPVRQEPAAPIFRPQSTSSRTDSGPAIAFPPEPRPELRSEPRPQSRREPQVEARIDGPAPDPVLDVPGYGEGPVQDPDDYSSAESPMLRRRSRSLPRFLGFLAIMVVLLGVGWFAWGAIAPLLSNPTALVGQGKPAGSDPLEAAADADASYITILSPTDTGGLRTEGRGRVEIVRQNETDMIRLVSVRPETSRDTPAEPLLVEIGEGALAELAGRRVTVEIQARSGTSSPATFAVGCDFAGQDACGRKRFRLGLQPEAIVFTIEMPQDIANGGKAFLTFSTDVTSTAGVAGEGDAIDVAFARLRYQKR